MSPQKIIFNETAVTEALWNKVDFDDLPFHLSQPFVLFGSMATIIRPEQKSW